MFVPISPQKENIVSNADVLKISSDTKKYIPAFSTSPKSMNITQNAGKKIEDATKFIQLEASEIDQSAEKPRFPIRIPIDQMKPKKNYLGLLKSDSFTEKKLSSTTKSQKSSRTEKPMKTVPSQNSQRIRTKVPQDLPLNNNKGKPQSQKRTEYLKSNNTLSERNDSFNESRNLKKSSEPRINDHLRTSHQSLEMNKAYGEKPKLSKNRASSTNRPASSRSFHNTKNKPLDEVRRSSELHPREKDNSRLGQEYLAHDMIHSEENKKELMKRTKMIITENLKKYHEQMKESKGNLEKMKEEKKALRERTQHMNQEIKEKNKLRNQSGSPAKHKYGWGVDQKRLEMKPQSRDNAERWQKKDSPKRREEIGLSHLNNLDEETVKKARTGWKQNIENKIKESEEKYKKKRTDKSPDEKEKIKKIIGQQFKKVETEKRKNSHAKLQEEKKKKERLEHLTKNIEEIRAKDQAEAEKHKSKPKKARKPFKVLDNDRTHHEEQEEEVYEEEEEEVIEEEVVEKPKRQKSSRINSNALKNACNILNSTLVKPTLKDAFSHWRRSTQRPARQQQESVKKTSNKNSAPQITPQKIDNEIPTKSAGKPFKTEQKVSYRDEELIMSKGRNQSEGRNLKSAAKTPAKDIVSAKKSLPPTSEKKLSPQQMYQPDFHENDEVFISDEQAEVIMKSQEYKKLFGYQKSGGKQNRIEHFEQQDIGAHVNPRDFEDKDFDDMLFSLSSEELIRMPYFSIAK